jgi:hypothetical protein
MVCTPVCETAVQLSVRTVYRYVSYCCVKQLCNCRYVLYIDMAGTAVCETALQLSLRNVYRYGGTPVGETAVLMSVRTVYRYAGYCCVCNSSATFATKCI